VQKRPVPELELEQVARILDRLPEVVDLRAVRRGAVDPVQRRGMVASSELAALWADRTKLISPNAFQDKTSALR
jgi:hypothetical protein